MTSQQIRDGELSEYCALMNCTLLCETNKTVFTPPKQSFISGAVEELLNTVKRIITR